ncbi:nucleotidyltransferase family protein [Priestia aryabhattai]|uniref:nucleotidyltransferase domain-containing protein n=1 Tax=Priestia aryabhattai TaxID=412384 RepID=UPI001CD1DF94|nr:nucleotidyltransferase family protein [Priestia aryabhattai]MCA1048640.1 nucleotidyltransferase family protein [Priestia aryabhattai]
MRTEFSFDEKLLSKELKLLLELMKTENKKKVGLDKSNLFKNINWNEFLELANFHRVYPIIYLKLKDLNEKLVPKKVMDALYEKYKHNTFQMLQLSSEMERINRLFNNNHIKVLFLKGPVIANDLYGDISLRTSKDLDVLIAEKDLDKANEILLQIGYSKEKTTTILNEKKWKKHHVIYFHTEKKTEVEIHWRLHPPPSKEPSFEELWERKRESSFNFSSIYFLGEEDLFLFLVVHGARHGWFRLRWLKDIDQVMKRNINLRKTEIITKKYQYGHLVGQALILVSALLDTPLPKELEALTKKKQSTTLARKAYLFISGFEDFTYHSRYLISLNLGIKKLLYIFILLYPNSNDLTTLTLPKILHFLYFPLKPFLLIWKKIKTS